MGRGKVLVTELAALQPGDQVSSSTFGLGRVELDRGDTVIVRFAQGLEECEKSDLQIRPTALQALRAGEWSPPLEVVTRLQALAIQSVNDTWGVFSRSRVALLPHQLWVCKRVLESWPARWLVADDVGLGKTIEAGLILWPLLSKGTVKRLLVLCPAALVAQWQYRLREMFDIRLDIYTPDADTPRSDYWNSRQQVVASIHTLREDRKGRHDRILESEPWDLLLIDEAHHVYHDEKTGKTQAFAFVEKLMDAKRVRSAVFFTGTPHRGKDFGFLSLLGLLRPDLFDDPQQPLAHYLPHLREVVIRNNKQNVTDLKGQRLFQLPEVRAETYAYSPEEGEFYDLLTEFVLSGKAWAASLGLQDRRAVMLVLIALQKLASSSVAAVRRALKRRLASIAEKSAKVRTLESARQALKTIAEYEELAQLGSFDQIAELDERIAELSGELRIIEDEEPRLHELIAAADRVVHETKIERIVSLLEDEFHGRSVLFFTEYKATQSLLMGALIRRFGESSVTFINGDNRAEDVLGFPLTQQRDRAAEDFNSGRVHYLVSTEAGGEGIDLQARCHTLVHVDLPWNPMRLHQRVGRVNRYGQRHRVEVRSLRNPDTVEARVWERLEEKIERIQDALGGAMDEPEDLMQLVLGMTNPSLFQDLFAEASTVPREQLSSWFDEKTAQFGGRGVIEAVKDLVGYCSRFDFQEVASEIPRLDLPDLKPFFLNALAYNRRQVRDEARGLAFKTPESWLDEVGVQPSYDGLVFARDVGGRDAGRRVLGVGHKVVNEALRQATELPAQIAVIPGGVAAGMLFVFNVTDRITSTSGIARTSLVGLHMRDPKQPSRDLEILGDAQLLERLNRLSETTNLKRIANLRLAPEDQPEMLEQAASAALEYIRTQTGPMTMAFKMPELYLIGIVSEFEALEQTRISEIDP